MYADVDFLLALLKEQDWLKENAQQVYEEQWKDIWTSGFALLELLIISKREGIDPVKTTDQVFELVEIRSMLFDFEHCQKAAVLMQQHGLTTLDAFHALACGDDSIISSDKRFDRVGLKRIKLEEFNTE